MASKSKSRNRNILLPFIIGGIILITLVIWLWPSPSAQMGGRRFGIAGGVVPVLTASAEKSNVPVYINGIGTTKALNTVTVTSQVDGILTRVLFREGQNVAQGDLLAEIDRRTYQATYDQAVAKLAQDKALLSNAQTDLERYTRLAQTNAASKQQADTQASLVKQYEAQLASDQAAIDSARTYLDYTWIKSPITGRTGLRQVDEGNVIRGSSSTPLVVITQMQPISIQFTILQQEVGRVNQEQQTTPIKVDALGADGKSLIDSGTLTVIDNQIDSATGTVRLKAEFSNSDMQLWPGQFVNVRMLVSTLKDVTVVPTAAIQRGPNGAFVYVMTPESAVTVRPVDIRQQSDTVTVVATGLALGEKVVTSGFSNLKEGTKVEDQGETAPVKDAANDDAVKPRNTRRAPAAAGGP